MINLTQIHDKLADALKHSGLTQTEIANRLGVKQSNISHYIKGDKMPALDTFANICAILDIDSNDILCIPQTVVKIKQKIFSNTNNKSKLTTIFFTVI